MFAVFFDQSMRYMKTGPLGVFPIQTEQFMDWRLLEQAGAFEVYNLTEKEQRVLVKLRCVAPVGPKSVIGPGGESHEFSPGQLQNWLMGPVVFAPGRSSVALTDPRWNESRSPLFIAGIDIEPVAEAPP